MLLAVSFSRPCPLSNRPCATTYRLAAVTFHRGFTARSGHYVACVRDLTKHKGPKFRALKRLKVTAAVSPSSELVSHVDAQRQRSSCLLNRKGTWQVTYLSAGAHVTCLEKTDHTISTFK